MQGRSLPGPSGGAAGRREGASPERSHLERNPVKYVVYHVASTMEKKAFKSAGVAMTVAEKMNVAAGKPEYAAASESYYHAHVVKMVEKKNMMSGLTYSEASNTPGYMSPSSEAYWSM
jgi:hypothetical protein